MPAEARINRFGSSELSTKGPVSGRWPKVAATNDRDEDILVTSVIGRSGIKCAYVARSKFGIGRGLSRLVAVERDHILFQWQI